VILADKIDVGARFHTFSVQNFSRSFLSGGISQGGLPAGALPNN
jgi:hypothetical protein